MAHSATPRCRVLALPAVAARDASKAAVADMREYFDPDGVWILSNGAPRRVSARCARVFDVPVVNATGGRSGDRVEHRRLSAEGDPDSPDSIDIVTVRDADALAALDDHLDADRVSAATATFLVCSAVDVDVRPTDLSAALSNAPELAAAVRALPGDVTVLTGALPGDYHHRWRLSPDGDALPESADESADESDADPADAPALAVPIHGMGSLDGYGGNRKLAALSLTADGTVGAELVSADSFGLRALSGVGEKTEERLRRAGIRTRADLAAESLTHLAEIRGIGRDSAEQLHAHAEVLETGDPVRRTNAALPAENGAAEPLCLDIETDSLTPTIIWQVGVYDPATDDHRAFVERTDPTDPGRVVTEFVEWYLGEHPDRPLLTWNGRRFDYPELTRFVERHATRYADDWKRARTYDLYKWAVTDGNALLPARTNKLEHVARRLGFDGADTGLDGAATAAAYQRFMRDPGPETALDWPRHEAYCEDDCRALWFVYEQLRAADRSTPDSRSGGDTAATTQQAGLSDF